VNRGGLFLRLPRLLLPGTPLEVTLHVPKKPLMVGGTVVWVEPPELWRPGESIGHGFQFHAPSWSTLACLSLLLVEPS
jgi:Tfp pilus assembly protein PilZ